MKTFFGIVILFCFLMGCTSSEVKQDGQVGDSVTQQPPNDSGGMMKPQLDTLTFTDSIWYVFTVGQKTVVFRHNITSKTLSDWKQVDSVVKNVGVEKLEGKIVLAVDSSKAYDRVHQLLDLIRKNKIVHFKLEPPLEE